MPWNQQAFVSTAFPYDADAFPASIHSMWGTAFIFCTDNRVSLRITIVEKIRNILKSKDNSTRNFL
jgi:hypothetical protein